MTEKNFLIYSISTYKLSIRYVSKDKELKKKKEFNF